MVNYAHVLACSVLTIVCNSPGTFAQSSFYGQTINVCPVDSQFGVSYTTDVTPISRTFTPNYYDQHSVRSDIECVVTCKNDISSCVSAYYDEDTAQCYLADESLHSMTTRSNQVLSSGSSVGSNLSDKKMITIKTHQLYTGRVDQSAECSSTSCADGSHTCRKDCTNNVGVCVAKFSECDETPVSNIRHWYWANFHSGTDSGNILTVTYKKQYSYTGLRVQFRGTIRAAYNAPGGCSRWYYTFNDVECQNPGPVEIVWYWGNGVDYYRPSRVDGICENLPAGDISVKFNVGACSGYDVPDAATGWSSQNIGVSLTIEENDLRHSFETNLQTYEGNAGDAACVFPFVYNGQSFEQCTDINHSQLWCATTSSFDADGLWGHCPGTCPGLSRFNIKQFSWTGERSEDNAHLYTYYYYKRASDTAIHVIFISNLYLSGHGTVRWTIKFGGSDCSDPGVIDGILAHLDSDVTDSMHDGTNAVTGMCNNIAAGRISVEVHIQQWTGSPNGHTGWISRSRIIVEEIRYDKDISAVITQDGSVQRLPEHNIHQWWFWSLNDGTDSGHIGGISVTYIKLSSLSQLRVYYQGDLRQLEVSQVRGAGCSRWYLTFNGAECSDPGPIAGLVYQYVFHNAEDIRDNHHHVSVIDGFCNLPAGSYNIRLYVQTCSGYSYNEAYTCWNSACRLIAKEVYSADW